MLRKSRKANAMQCSELVLNGRRKNPSPKFKMRLAFLYQNLAFFIVLDLDGQGAEGMGDTDRQDPA